MRRQGDAAARERALGLQPATQDSSRTPKVSTEVYLEAWLPAPTAAAPVLQTGSWLSSEGDAARGTGAPSALSGSRDTLPVSLDRIALERPSLLRAGQRLGPYEIGGPIGRGGMGLVYEARDLTLRRTVAIKLLRPGSADRHRVDRFLEEARIAARLGHPGFVTIHAFGTIPDGESGAGTPYLVMERLHGKTLRACLDEGLDAAVWIAIFEELLSALAYAHGRSLVHRDLKPENVFRTGEGRIKILDFGLAGLLHDGDVDLPMLQAERSGTETYMAPETWARERPTAAVDVWALGVMLHQALFHGAHPFWDLGASRQANIAALGSTQSLQLLRGRRGPFPRPILGVIERALLPSLEARFPDAAAMLLSLRQATRPAQRWRRPALAIAALLLAGLGVASRAAPGALGTVWSRRSAPADRAAPIAPSLATRSPGTPPPAASADPLRAARRPPPVSVDEPLPTTGPPAPTLGAAPAVARATPPSATPRRLAPRRPADPVLPTPPPSRSPPLPPAQVDDDIPNIIVD